MIANNNSSTSFQSCDETGLKVLLQMTESAKTFAVSQGFNRFLTYMTKCVIFHCWVRITVSRQRATDFHMGARCENKTYNMFCSKQVHRRVLSTQIHSFWKKQEQSGHKPTQYKNRDCSPIKRCFFKAFPNLHQVFIVTTMPKLP